MYPGLPTSLHGDVVVTTDVDEDCQANIVEKDGKAIGVWLDDTTPNLQHWVDKAVAKYRTGQSMVFVCVPPNHAGKHYPAPIVSVLEWYLLDDGEPPKYDAYIVRWNWPGVSGHDVLTDKQREHLLSQVEAHSPRFIFKF